MNKQKKIDQLEHELEVESQQILKETVKTIEKVKIISISLPREILKKLDKYANLELRNRSEMVRQMIRKYKESYETN